MLASTSALSGAFGRDGIIERAHETSAQLLLDGEHRAGSSTTGSSRAPQPRATSSATRQEEVTRQVGAIVMAATEVVVAAEIDASPAAFIGETIDAAEAMA